MKKSIVALVVSINIFIIFFWVAQNNYHIKLSFEKQDYEKTKIALLKEKEQLQQRLCLAQSKSEIKKFAKNELTMEKIKPHNIKKTSQSS